MLKVKQNKTNPSISARVEQAKNEKAEPVVRQRLMQIAESLTDLSPVWSGAYVTSHSFVPKGSGGGRMRKSREDMGPVDPWQKRDEALKQLFGDINSVDFMATGGGVFRNRSPHARGVEDGTPPALQAYNVYRTTAARFK
jgi:hypothetical protein